MITEDEIRSALNEVIHPSFGMSLVALGMVRSVKVGEDGVEVGVVMTCPGCPAGEAALASARRRLAALNAGPVRLILLPEPWKPPWEGAGW